jgi:tRNA pseudouridine13 synthase
LPNWPRVAGDPLFHGVIRQTPGDFRVAEQLGFAPSGQGDHDWLWTEKTGENTTWVARALARHAGVAVRDVGFSGLKDRQAVTRQWFSVPRSPAHPADWTAFENPAIRVLEVSRNPRKLKRGVHRSNAFRIVIRGAVPAEDLGERLAAIARSGVPNYFGRQRFGHGGRNIDLALALFAGKRLKRELRSIALSAARSLLFNDILSARVLDETWDTALAGELLNLDGSGSLFECERVDDTIRQRCRQLDVHPTGALWGSGEPGGGAADLERRVASEHAALAAGLEKAGVRMARRALRVRVDKLTWETTADRLTLAFELGRGSYATAVVREIAEVSDETG